MLKLLADLDRFGGCTLYELAERYGVSARTIRRDFAALEARLGAEMLARLQEERDLQRRASIYRFPQQFHAMGPLVGEFLAQAGAGA